MSNLILILGDQLTPSISSLDGFDKPSDTILMCEVWEETSYVKHHKKKIAFIFSAMRHFAEELRLQGYRVLYTKLDAEGNSGSFRGEVKRILESEKFEHIIVTEPGEYRVLEDMRSWQDIFNVPVTLCPDNRFLCAIDEFALWAKDRKQLRMEFFYREMRQKHNILMDGREPVGGKWNFDSDNRKFPSQLLAQPSTYVCQTDSITDEVIELVVQRFNDHFGDLEPFHFAVAREQALQALEQFIKQRLAFFGDYQDAMIQDEPWMFHSHLSFYINCGLLLPLECIKAAELAYFNGKAPLNAVEGFIRQILGWREYVRGIYWLKMPDYASVNFFNAKRKLPSFYWTADTKMNCLKQCITETKQHAYAHHIQRLMVLGNFALLAGIDPAEVKEWYLIVYADAFEWVELPNVSGMILFADGGYLASKPYAAGGSYINKMSNYCKSCRYDVKQKNGKEACPFNYLYWNFLAINQDKLKNNQRLGMIYNTYNRMSDDKKREIASDSQAFFEQWQ